MSTEKFTSWPFYTAEEARCVSSVLLSNKVNYWTGEEGRAFEEEFSNWIGVKYAVALANGTLALEAALRALGVGPGDEVVVTPRSFIASVSCIVLSGATPVFADIDIASQNITAETVSSVLTQRTKAIICVHLAGWPCEMNKIMELAEQNDLYVIEDCSQAHGARYSDKSVGSYGHIATWSFCQDKIMTTGGEGGMITTNSHSLWERVWSFKDHGKSSTLTNMKNHSSEFRWVHDSFGSNMRITEMQAAIGRIQLSRMPVWHKARKRNAWEISQACIRFSDVLRVPPVPNYVEHAWYKYYAFIRPDGLKAGWSRKRIVNEINELGVPCYTGSCSEIYLEKAFDKTPFRPRERLPSARELGETSLMFLVHPSLTDNEISRTCEAIEKTMKLASQ